MNAQHQCDDLVVQGAAAHTPGPWYAGHITDPNHPCNCRSIVCEGYAGAIASIDVGNSLRIGEGGNDAPPLNEAIANARLIAASPDFYAGAALMLAAEDGGGDLWWKGWDMVKAALRKATTGSR